MIKRILIAHLALFLSSCLAAPAEMRRATPEEQRWVDDVREAWFVAGRGRPRCSSLDRVDVVPLPQREVAGACLRPNTGVRACVFEVNQTVFSSVSTLVYVTNDVDARTHRALVIHEYLHVMRGCWWADSGRDVTVLRHGSTDECRIAYPSDHLHCDLELWVAIEDDAIARSNP